MKHFSLLFLTFFSSLLMYGKDVNVATAGQLQELIPANEKFSITELTITGNLNGADILFIREMAGADTYGMPTSGKLEKLDMSKANIVEGSSTYKGSFATKANIVGESMFSGCNKLVTLKLPENVTEIEKDAFSNCSKMSSITLPTSLKAIGEAAFVSTGLTEITIPEGVSKISAYLFYYSTGLQTINLPTTVVEIGDEAFTGCPIANINVTAGNPAFATENGVLFTSNKTKLILYPAGKEDQAYTLPTSTKAVGKSAFKDAKFQKVTLNAGLEEIQEHAFENCTNLQAINMPNSVVQVGVYAFNKCSNLETVTISEGLKKLSENMFGHCHKLDNVTVPNNITKIDATAFSYCKKLTNISLPNQLDTIGKLAFNECRSLQSLTIPNSVTFIDRGAFYGCTSLSAITLPTEIEEISYQMFFGCTSLKELVIPNKEKYIMWYAFQASGLEKITIPESCIEINDMALACPNLTEIVNYNPTPQTLGMFVFNEVPKTCILYVPKGAVETYKQTETWKDFTDIREIANTSIANVEPNSQAIEIARYNAQGQRIFAPQSGINFVHMSNGKVEKVLVK